MQVVHIRSAHAKAVQLNGELCESIINTLVAEVRRHFGFVPLPLENKVDQLKLQLQTCLPPSLNPDYVTI